MSWRQKNRHTQQPEQQLWPLAMGSKQARHCQQHPPKDFVCAAGRDGAPPRPPKPVRARVPAGTERQPQHDSTDSTSRLHVAATIPGNARGSQAQRRHTRKNVRCKPVTKFRNCDKLQHQSGPTQGPHSIVDIILAQFLTIGRRKVVKLRSVGREEAAEDD